MLSQQIKEVAHNIGQFYLNKCKFNYDEARKAIEGLHISKVDVVNNTVQITTARPGILIGARGENIENLTKFLNMKVCLFEDMDPLIEHLIPHRYDNDE